jgi:hypothetical protein
MVGGLLLAGCLLRWSSPLAADSTDVKTGAAPVIIDTHAHIVRSPRRANPAATVGQALRAMDEHRVEMTILLPPPFPPGHRGAYGRHDLEPIARDHPRRFAFVAGGESLNPMIHRVAPEKVTPGAIRELQREAQVIVKAEAVGFGELTLEHFSSGRGGHPYESTRPDHPLLLALADVAAHHAMPIDLHMEAVPRDMATPPPPGGRVETAHPGRDGCERLVHTGQHLPIVGIGLEQAQRLVQTEQPLRLRDAAAGERVQQTDLLRAVRGGGPGSDGGEGLDEARGLASGAEAGKELEHGAVEGLGLLPVGEVTGGREQDELGVRDHLGHDPHGAEGGILIAADQERGDGDLGQALRDVVHLQQRP